MVRGLVTMLLLLSTVSAWAGTISINVSGAAMIYDRKAVVATTVTNLGDTPARYVRVTVSLGRIKDSSAVKAQLDPRASWPVRLALDNPALSRPGSYTVLIRVDFFDQAGQAYSALSYASLKWKEETVSLIWADSSEVLLKDQGGLSLPVISHDWKKQRVRVSLAVPSEFSVEPVGKNIELGAGEQQTVVFDLKNISARTGAVYPVLGLVEYDSAARHYSSVVKNLVIIGDSEKFFKKYQRLLLVLALFLSLVAATVQIASSKKTDPKEPLMKQPR